MPTPTNWQVVATNEPAGTALVNGTPTILSYTAPADGHTHAVEVFFTKTVTSAETGGAVAAQIGANSIGNINLSGGGGAAGTFPNGQQCLLGSGQTLNINQTTALTAGASSVVATIVAAQ